MRQIDGCIKHKRDTIHLQKYPQRWLYGFREKNLMQTQYPPVKKGGKPACRSWHHTLVVVTNIVY
ncbi:hypothetical protein AF72_03420 [Xylella taiwanensis]|uniref:Uncharacterized protein n=1 Tax=Xylella taiwanensis TaxID=1444770 RepID=Z9JL76_9GAMM|nr:hypothetical protein AB672_09480 [Xylella taiwanensis]EWS78944.1 hypothetical protein AF72_03420 [Xylella taiwanensis]